VSRLFISHSSRNDDWAIALRDWLVNEGWSGSDDIFLDLDPERGIAAGQRWAKAFEDAATRCEAVLFLVSEDWLASRWCHDEYQLAAKYNKKLFALLIDDIAFERLPGGLVVQWQLVRLKGEPAERFVIEHPHTQAQSPVHIAKAGLARLKSGLQKAGIGPETFELQPDAAGPFGWRAPYRGLEALEPEDAAVFFGRSADIVRGIDALRGLATRKPPRLLVILGASGAGKSSFLRAGLWPRLARDDSQWLPLRAIRAGRGGAIEGQEGLLAALEEVHRRFALRASRSDLRERLAGPEQFIGLLRELRQVAAKRVLLSQPPFPLPVICLDQGEELFGAEAGAESEKLLALVRAAIDAGEALALVTIRSDAYGRMQNAKPLAGVDQVPLSLGPVPQGEIARVIREPAEILRRKVGLGAPVFDPAVIEGLQAEMEGEADALPLLAFVLQRLMREHAGASVIGLEQLNKSGGLAEAIESEAEGAFKNAGYSPDRADRREVLRRLFVPRLARINRDSKVPQRRVAQQSDLPGDLLPLARALTACRLLVVRAVAKPEGEAGTSETATLEVAHEALLRRWTTLAEVLGQDRDSLLLLDGVLLAAADWDKGDATTKPDFVAHHGSRLVEAQALAARGPDWAREIAPARDYLAACQAREEAERAEAEQRRREREEEQARRLKDAHKLTRVIGAALVAALILAATAAGFGIYAWRAQARAEAALDAATETANGLIFNLAQRFRDVSGVPVALIKDMLDRALHLQEQLTQAGQVTPELRRSQAVALREISLTLLDQGDTKGAFDAANHARQIMQDLLAAEPGNADWQYDLGISNERIGDVLMAQGNLDGALKSYQARRDIIERLAKSDPGNAVWQRDLSVSYNKVGDAQVAQGDLPAALKSYGAGLAIFERLAKSDPGNAGWQRDLSWAYENVGDVQVKQGDFPAALKSYQAEFAIIEVLAKSDPGNAGWQHDLAEAYSKIGNVQVAQGDMHAALKSYQAFFAIIELLAKSDSGNADWQHDLAVAYEKVGDVKVKQGDFPAALKSYQVSFAIIELLAKSDPGNAGWQDDLSGSYEKVGDVQKAQGDLPAALKSYRAGLAIREHLAKTDPGNADWQRDLVFSLYRLSTVTVPADARAALLRAVSILDPLVRDSKLTAAQQNWPQMLREALAKLPPA
jgi:tetratricopeptide (TPR) repeat protein